MIDEAPSRNPWRTAALVFVIVWFFVGGAGHFALTNMFTSVVPPYVPYPREMVLFTGACEMAGAVGLLVPQLRRIAGLALIALTLCVTPVHIDMLLHAERYERIGPVVLWARLLFQPVFIWIVWFATQMPAVARRTLGEGGRGAS